MSKASRGDPFLAAMTEGQEADAVFRDHADEKVSEDLPESLETLRNAYQEFWAETHPPDPVPAADDSGPENSTEIIDQDARRQSEALGKQEDLPATTKSGVLKPRLRAKAKVLTSIRRAKQPKVRNSSRPPRQRFGLPEGFVPRMQRFGRGVLLELNIYSLPNGQEFIPCLPTGPLGSRHLYALLTGEQYLRGKRGSVYVRGDGSIFDYSVVSANSLGDMFDTGYTIYDLERTGRYAPGTESKKRTARAADKLKRSRKQKAQPKKFRRAAGAR